MPKSWRELTQPQLHYVYVLLSLGTPMSELKVWCFIRFTGMNVASRAEGGWNFALHKSFTKTEYFFLSDETIAWGANQLSFLDEYPKRPVVVEHFGNYYAVDPLLHDISFGEYLTLENLYQGFLYSNQQEPLIDMARILYRDNNGNRPPHPNTTLCMCCAVWFASFKKYCTEHWPHLFPGGSSDEEREAPNMEEVMNAQIRALTGGDATKEKEVLALNLWRALTEMDAKVRDAEEQKRRLDELKK